MSETGVKHSWYAYWNEHSINTYLYGTTMQFLDKTDVKYHNELMPPGTVIKKWFSKTNFQMMHVEPALPMIDGESEYRLTIDCTQNKGENLLLRIVFFDRFDKEIGNQITTDRSIKFQCPLATYSYVVELVNGGCSDFVFHRLVIQELLDANK